MVQFLHHGEAVCSSELEDQMSTDSSPEESFNTSCIKEHTKPDPDFLTAVQIECEELRTDPWTAEANEAANRQPSAVGQSWIRMTASAKGKATSHYFRCERCDEEFAELSDAEAHEAACTIGVMRVFALPHLHAYDSDDDSSDLLDVQGCFSSQNIFWNLDQGLVDLLLEKFSEVDTNNSDSIDSTCELEHLAQIVAHVAFTKFNMKVRKEHMLLHCLSSGYLPHPASAGPYSHRGL